MSKSNVFENDFLQLVFNNVDIAGIGDAGGLRGSVVAGSLYASLHTADPGEAGDQTTNEAAYTSYARVAIARTVGGWTVAGNNGSNAALAQWPQATGGSETENYFGIGTDSSGAGKLMGSGVLVNPLAVSVGIRPEAEVGELDWNED